MPSGSSRYTTTGTSETAPFASARSRAQQFVHCAYFEGSNNGQCRKRATPIASGHATEPMTGVGCRDACCPPSMGACELSVWPVRQRWLPGRMLPAKYGCMRAVGLARSSALLRFVQVHLCPVWLSLSAPIMLEPSLTCVADHALPHKGRALHNLSSRTIDIPWRSSHLCIPPAQNAQRGGQVRDGQVLRGCGPVQLHQQGAPRSADLHLCRSCVWKAGNDDGEALLTCTTVCNACVRMDF
jgi:hypothetical protein